MEINGIHFIEPIFDCPCCGNGKLTYRFVESNSSIQARCTECGKWYGNIKYDKRSKKEIHKEKVKEWLRKKGDNHAK